MTDAYGDAADYRARTRPPLGDQADEAELATAERLAAWASKPG